MIMDIIESYLQRNFCMVVLAYGKEDPVIFLQITKFLRILALA